VKLQVTVLFAESVPVHVTVVVPTLKVAPDGGLQEVFTQFPVVVGAA
jgi:hypothetical protein